MTSQRVVLSDLNLNVATVNWKYCVAKGSVQISCPPGIVWNILTHPENHKIFRAQKACILRQPISEEGGRLEAEVEHIATWSFSLGSGTFRLRQIIVQESDHTISYRLSKPGMMSMWQGTWAIEPAPEAVPLEVGNFWALSPGESASTQLRFEHKMQLTVWPLPPFDKVVNSITSQMIEDMLIDLVREADRIRAGKSLLHYVCNPAPVKVDLTENFPDTPVPSTPGTPSSTCSYNPWAEDARVEVNSFALELSDIEEDEDSEDEELDCSKSITVAASDTRQVPLLQFPSTAVTESADISESADDPKGSAASFREQGSSAGVKQCSNITKQVQGSGTTQHKAALRRPLHMITPRSLLAAFFPAGSRDNSPRVDKASMDHLHGEETASSATTAPVEARACSVATGTVPTGEPVSCNTATQIQQAISKDLGAPLQHDALVALPAPPVTMPIVPKLVLPLPSPVENQPTSLHTCTSSEDASPTLTAPDGQPDSASMVKVNSFVDWLPGSNMFTRDSAGQSAAASFGSAGHRASLRTALGASLDLALSCSSSDFSSSDDDDDENDLLHDTSRKALDFSLMAARPPNIPPIRTSLHAPSSNLKMSSSHGGLVQLQLSHRAMPTYHLAEMMDAIWMGHA